MSSNWLYFSVLGHQGDYLLLDTGQDYYETQGGEYKGTLMKGTPFMALEVDEEWVKIELPNGEVGWVER